VLASYSAQQQQQQQQLPPLSQLQLTNSLGDTLQAGQTPQWPTAALEFHGLQQQQQ